MKKLLPIALLLFALSARGQTWIDSLDRFAREVHLPARNFVWNWQNAALLHAMEFQYEYFPEPERAVYLEYVRRAMQGNFFWANGLLPNFVAPGNGMVFLYRISAEQRYLDAALGVYDDYVNIVRTANGGVSHLPWTLELWDDTVYMIGIFLLGMYRATGQEEYIEELLFQIAAHRDKLRDEATGLWVHAWDEDGVYTFDFCSQADWADPETGRSQELWGRGNGWVVVTLSELLNTLPEGHPERATVEGYLLEMIENLPAWQDAATGHWYQLPARAGEEGNFIESSATAMFGYGILTALKHNLVEGGEWEEAVERAYLGLREHSAWVIDPVQGYLNTRNVCAETCIGDKDYYFSREVANGRSYALAMFIIFGRSYEAWVNGGLPTAVLPGGLVESGLHLYPMPVAGNGMLRLTTPANQGTEAWIILHDLAGREVQRHRVILAGQAQATGIPLNGLPAGHYALTVREGSGRWLATSPVIVY